MKTQENSTQTQEKRNGNNLIGMKEICQVLGVSEATALKWHREYEMPIKKVDGIWIGSRKKLDEWFVKFSEKK